jgi:TRAP-type C4-dicarboxylate transport system substrate-binding protein
MMTFALLASAAHADPVLLRMATPAPDGTAWARELRAFARDVQTHTSDALQMKWYLGGIAGDDVVAAERIKKGQLDGIGSGGMLCERVSPTLRAMHMLAETRDESWFLLNRLRTDIDEEMKKGGFVFLAAAGLGPTVLFTREPIHTFDELKKTRLWIWELDEVARTIFPAVGMHTVPLPVTDGYKAYEENRTDGFVAVPMAALAFQWSAQTRYVTDLHMGFLNACVMVSQRAFDLVPAESREAFRAAGAKLQRRMEDMGRLQDEQLLKGGLFVKQGLTPRTAEPGLRDGYEKAARDARVKLAPQLAPRSQIEKVEHFLAEYRRSHP